MGLPPRSAFALTAWLLVPACAPASPGPTDLVVTTYNTLIGAADSDPWSVRERPIAAILADTDADVIALQEPLPAQLADLEADLPGYGTLAPLWPYTDVAMLYRSDRWNALQSGAGWLAPSVLPWGYGNFLPRAYSWVELEDRETGAAVYVVDTHFDHNEPFQENAAPLLLDVVRPKMAELPTIVLGDFNSTPSDPAYDILAEELVDAFVESDSVQLLEAEERSWHPDERIDHVWLGPGWTVDAWSVDLSRYGDPPRDPSDHHAVTVALHRE